ncbi:hypothetical protein LO763_19750 [Glycomyces sp. A-F 0318]|uniref:hypothetical protein n=1 Tax=Glycomyces amatae TaxID=2881355 RepID=UPI001E2A9DD7|nr:hypothetical protein [Glycomyces amatae]MCD0445847.1 hypothetical protein [Glycomyces amatae]
MNPTILTILILAAYLTIAALAWRPAARYCLTGEREEHLRWHDDLTQWDRRRAMRKSGAIALFAVLLWPYTAVIMLLITYVPPVYRRAMNRLTAGIDPEPPDANAPSTHDALDDLEPIDAVAMAWTVPGDSPATHAIQKRHIAARMPELARALDRLTHHRTADM